MMRWSQLNKRVSNWSIYSFNSQTDTVRDSTVVFIPIRSVVNTLDVI